MRFDLDELNPGVWDDLIPEQPDKGRLCLRPASAEVLEELHKKHTKKQTTYHRHQPVVEEVTDEDAYKRDLWDYSIVDWQGVQDAEGKDIPCTRDNKAKLLLGSPLFLRLYGRCLDRVEALMEKQGEDEQGN